MKLIEKIAKIQQEVSITKDGKNPFFKSQYITLDNILSKLNPLFEKHKIYLINYNKEGGVCTTIYDYESEDFVTSNFIIQDLKDPQKAGQVLTYGRRYNLVSLFNIIADKDDDGESYYDREKAEKPVKAKKVFGKAEYDGLVKSKGDYIDSRAVLAILDQKGYTVSKEYEDKIEDLYK